MRGEPIHLVNFTEPFVPDGYSHDLTYSMAKHTSLQQYIELANPARELATTHVHYLDSEIQTWQPYSSTRFYYVTG